MDRALNSAPSHRVDPKTSRNEPCPCGSGKKYKKCCGH
ncbi:SEC-C metal-binding domain-containing protein [Dehalococcoidia bacterium]|nr:SEC-C metal-binding domain-containing protein [Dehalococcoidia bacterium]